MLKLLKSISTVTQQAVATAATKPQITWESLTDSERAALQEMARNLPGAQGWAARFGSTHQDYYAKLLMTPEGQAEIERQRARDGGLGSGGGILDKVVRATVGSDLFIPAIKTVVAVGGGVAGATAVKGMTATKSAPYVPQWTATEKLIQETSEAQMLDASNGDIFDRILTAGVDLGASWLNSRLTQKVSTGAGGDIVRTMGALPPLTGAMVGTGVVAAGGAMVRAVGGRIMTALGAMTRKRVVAIAKQLGIHGASAALGIGAVELAQMVLDEQGRKGRGKGVSAAALRTTRRTMRTVERMHRQIASYCRDAGVRTTRFVKVPQPAFGKKCR